MTRSYSLLALVLLGLGTIFAWQQTRANDDGSPIETAVPAEANSQNLIERIEALEKRIAILEAEKPLVRQADNREAPGLAAPDTLPEDVPSDDDKPQTTNGTKWRFRTLSYRSSAE